MSDRVRLTFFTPDGNDVKLDIDKGYESWFMRLFSAQGLEFDNAEEI